MCEILAKFEYMVALLSITYTYIYLSSLPQDLLTPFLFIDIEMPLANDK